MLNKVEDGPSGKVEDGPSGKVKDGSSGKVENGPLGKIKKIVDLWKNEEHHLNREPLQNFYKRNINEDVVLLNTWFITNDIYSNYIENAGQKIRQRYRNQVSLTPLKSDTNNLEIFNNDMITQYQPNYPESFYTFWDMMNKYKFKGNYLTLVSQIRWGSNEAILLYLEKNVLNYKVDTDGNDIDLLSQLFRNHTVITEIKNKYFTIIIDVNILYPKPLMFEKNELFWDKLNNRIKLALKHLLKNGNLIISCKIPIYNYQQEILEENTQDFLHCCYYRSSIAHPVDDSIYLICMGYKNGSSPITIKDTYYQHLLRWNQYKGHINIPIYKSMKNVSELKNIKFKYRSEILEYEFKSNKKYKLKINNNLDKTQLNKSYGKLAFHKRIMDTKPSLMYLPETDKRKNKFNYLKWEDINALIDPYSILKTLIPNNYNGEMVSNAWLKMWEMAHYLKLKNINSFHLCEAPGSFPSALHHYSITINKKFNWKAQTLISTEKNALEDRYNLINYKSKHWDFGKTNNGDIINIDNIKHYIKNKYNLVTADGGIVMPTQWINDQEIYCSKLFFSEWLTIIGCLEEKGTGILKYFLPLTCPLTESIIYISTCIFDNVKIIKPTTSHQCNSEIYIIMSGFKKCNYDELLKFHDAKHDEYLVEISEEFHKEYLVCINKFIDNQIHHLNMAYYCYYYNVNDFNHYNDYTKWLEKYPISYLNKSLLE